jgi:probable rRNA maturation factor
MAFAITFIDDWEPILRDSVLRVLAALQSQPDIIMPIGSVNLKLVDDRAIAALNEQYTGNAYATDVLTFDYRETTASATEPGDIPGSELADIAISHETAARQATEANISPEEEIAVLALHGLLHILGYDHQTPAQRQTLQELQDRILDSAGLAKQEFRWDD